MFIVARAIFTSKRLLGDDGMIPGNSLAEGSDHRVIGGLGLIVSVEEEWAVA
jgi:hypothetical protein